MNLFELEKKFYIGASRNGNWSSVYSYKPRNENIFQEKGEIFAVITLQGPTGFNAVVAGNLLLDHLHESYFESKESSPLLALEGALVATAKRLAEIVDNDQNVGDAGIDLDISAMAVVDKICYFVNMGQGMIYILRDGNVIKVNSALKDPTGDGYIKSASSVIKKNDIFLISSPQAAEAYTKDEVLQALDEFDDELLKTKPLGDESALSFIMIGVEPEIKPKAKEKDIEVISRFVKKEEPLIEDKSKQDLLDEEMEMKKRDVDDEDYDEIEVSDSDNEPNFDEYEEDDEEEVKPKSTTRLSSRNQGDSIIEKIKSMFVSSQSKIRNNIKNLELDKKIKSRIDNLKPEDSEDTTAVYLMKRVRAGIDKAILFLRKNFWEDFLQMDQGIYLKNARRGTNWRFIIFIGVVGAILLFFAFRIISNNQEIARQDKEITDTISKVNREIEKLNPEVASILGVVDVYTRERSTYQKKIDELKKDLDAVSKFNKETDKINQSKDKVTALENKLNRKILVKDPDVLMDFVTQISENVRLTDIEIADGKVFVTDEQRNVIYSIDYDGSGFKELVKDLNSPKSLVVNQDGELISVDANQTQPFFSVNINNGTIKRFSGILASGLSSVKQIEEYTHTDGSDRIYFLKSEGKPVQYISKVGAGYSGAFDRLDDQTFSNSRDLEIVNGTIYLLVPGEGVVKYFGTDQSTYTLFGLSSQEAASVANSSAFDISSTYIIYGNSPSKSIMFTTRSRGDDTNVSDYIAQIIYTGEKNYLNDIKEIKVDYTTGDIFVLDGGRLLRFDFDDIRPFLY